MIRLALQKDVSQIYKLMKSVPGFWRDDWRDDVVERGIDISDGLAFVWEDEEQIKGFVCAHDLGFRCYMSALVVAPDVQGRSIGTHLVRYVERELCARGCTVLIADVWNEAESYFFKELGWVRPTSVLMQQNLFGRDMGCDDK
ncbi:MAG: GNAT family N-acetyltransferase [Chloroflexi bacterium]|nr:GNAT family N-acetyltransferase [Chloroflexota bacterium]